MHSNKAFVNRQGELFELSDSVNKTSSVNPSSESIGPTSQSTTMSEPSRQVDLEELTSSAEDFPVSPGVRPGGIKAQMMTVTSGRKWLGLLNSYNLPGSLVKMSQVLLKNRWASDVVYLTWRIEAMPPSHLRFRLVPQKPSTSAIESGFWATPTAHIHKENACPAEWKRKTASLTIEAHVEILAKMWPTPTSTERSGINPKTGKGGGLSKAIKMWPTPTSSDDRDRGNLSIPSIQRRKRLGKQLNLGMVASMDRGALNPDWVEYLMGFPIGWTSPTSQKLKKEEVSEDNVSG